MPSPTPGLDAMSSDHLPSQIWEAILDLPEPSPPVTPMNRLVQARMARCSGPVGLNSTWT